MRKFNVTGTCIPEENYMVDITGKLIQIKAMIDAREYFTINRGRQYGKTTTLLALEHFLSDEYTVIAISFEGLGEKPFSNEEYFCQTFMRLISKALRFTTESKEYGDSWLNPDVKGFETLSEHMTDMCEEKKLVLTIDEVDKTSNNMVFLKFLSKLREKYLARKARKDFTFHSVILAGVYDIKNIKLKLIQEGLHLPTSSETITNNSPWNIAADFKVDMAFNAAEIATMLVEYEKDYKTGMDVVSVSKELYTYTNGYPFMVSRLCQIIHDTDQEWNIYGVRNAVGELLKEDNTLFKDMAKNLENHKELYRLLYDVMILGVRRSFSHDNPVISMAYRYGYIKIDQRYSVAVFNKIFETRISNYFVTKNEQSKPHQRTSVTYYNIATEDHFNMELCLEKFAAFFNQEIFPTKEKELLEIQYRISFLSYLKPLLNGIGHYHYESQLSDERRMDLIVNYGRHEYILELKRIFTESDRTEGLDQLLGYMDGRNADVGYYLTFDFRKKSESKVEWLSIDGKRIFEVSV